ncbi:MAG: hypothetical protein R2822_02145 [Spirosomataceae bacterium]
MPYQPKTDCNHILTSPAAKITPWLGWSEVGFFYFMGGWILNYSSLRGEGMGDGV